MAVTFSQIYVQIVLVLIGMKIARETSGVKNFTIYQQHCQK